MRLRRVLALLGSLIVLATGTVACGDGGGEETTSASGGIPGMVEAARFDGIESGELELALEIDDRVVEKEINMRILGIFINADEDELPQFDMAVEAKGYLDGKELDYFGGLLVDEDRMVLHHEGVLYQPDPETFETIMANFEDAQDGGEGDATACWEAAEAVEFGQVVKNLSNEGKGITLDEAPTTIVSADLDVGGAIDALAQMHEDPACGAQLDAALPLSIPQLQKEKAKIVAEAKDPLITFFIGKNGVLRQLDFHTTLKPREGKGRRGEIEIDFDLRLNKVNETEHLPNPIGSKRFDALADVLGYNPVEALEDGEEDGLLQLLEAFTGPPSASGSS